MASKRNENVLWNEKSSQASIFARELAGLFAADYELRRLPDGSEVMIPPKRPVSFSLSYYMDILTDFMTRENVKAMTISNLREMLFIQGTKKIMPYTEPLYL